MESFHVAEDEAFCNKSLSTSSRVEFFFSFPLREVIFDSQVWFRFRPGSQCGGLLISNVAESRPVDFLSQIKLNED